jgi:hypothetical protein
VIQDDFGTRPAQDLEVIAGACHGPGSAVTKGDMSIVNREEQRERLIGIQTSWNEPLIHRGGIDSQVRLEPPSQDTVSYAI